MIQTLIARKVFKKQRFMNEWFVVGVDATGIGIFPKGHCDQCLHQTSKK